MKRCSLLLLFSLVGCLGCSDDILTLSMTSWNDGDDALLFTVTPPTDEFAYGALSSTTVGDRFLLPFTVASATCTRGLFGTSKFPRGFVATQSEVLVDLSRKCEQFVVRVAPPPGVIGIVEINSTFISSRPSSSACSDAKTVILNLASSKHELEARAAESAVGKRSLGVAKRTVETGARKRNVEVSGTGKRNVETSGTRKRNVEFSGTKRDVSTRSVVPLEFKHAESGCSCAIGCGIVTVNNCTGTCGIFCPTASIDTTQTTFAGVKVRAFVHVPYHREDYLTSDSVCGPRVDLVINRNLLWSSEQQRFDDDGVISGETEFITAQHMPFTYEARVTIPVDCSVHVWDSVVTLLPVSSTIALRPDELFI